MIYQQHIPQAPLSRFVDSLWYFRSGPTSITRERVLPYGSFELILNLGCESPFALLSGPQSQPVVIDPSQLVSVMGVHFRPGGAAPFLKIPAGEFHNTDAPLDVLWGASSRELIDRLRDSARAEARFRILEAFLLERLSRSDAASPAAVGFALREFQTLPHARKIADVVEQTGFSQSRFIALFSRTVGLTPKVFCRVQRFQSVLARTADRQPVDWPDIALACGYFDQAHLIHEFRTFSGMTPQAYLAQRGEFQNHVQLID